VNCAVSKRLCECVIDEPVLVEEREPLEARARHDHLEVVAAAGAVLDTQLLGVGKRVAQQGFETLDSHAGIVLTPPGPRATCVPLAAMEEIGLFPLGIVLLPTERVPLHIFEPRYRELIGECLDADGEFGLLYADEDGVREVGTRARVADVLEEFDDGRLNIVVEGGVRFRVQELTRGHSYMTAVVEPLEDDGEAGSVEAAGRAAGSFRALAALAGAETDDPDERSAQLSFELAAQVELAPEAKQQLLESRSELERLELVAELLDAARQTLIATHELGERAKKNGSRLA
jgi:Lon protease-like protein